ncbi:hypothetical protein V6N11_013651 [Hibiscus sabdariffa]|uniref:PLATZ transcription factor family protein n=2 Tax=Hibiscus sabdariffa TaxID=183260 RepID=A0ABR2AWI1_9ROSI
MRPTHIAAVARRRFSFMYPPHLSLPCLQECICPNCFSPHSSHRLLQIRRYVYHDVIRLDDATRLMDCASVQSYITNSAKVIFINQRPQTRQFRGSGNFCSTCDRSLQDPYLFCSLSCKVNYMLRTEDGVSRFLFECNFLPLPEAASEDGLVTPDSVLEPSGSTKTSSGSGACGEVSLNSTATTEVVRRKRSSLKPCRGPTCPPTVSEGSGSLMNRRKKTPQRAPLY